MSSTNQSPQKIYVAPDGSRIQAGPTTGVGVYQTGPSQSAGAYHGARTQSFAPSPTSYHNPQISVGLLAWGVILVIAGLLLVLAPLFGVGSLQALIVVTFAVAGAAFLGLAYMTSRGESANAEASAK